MGTIFAFLRYVKTANLIININIKQFTASKILFNQLWKLQIPLTVIIRSNIAFRYLLNLLLSWYKMKKLQISLKETARSNISFSYLLDLIQNVKITDSFKINYQEQNFYQIPLWSSTLLIQIVKITDFKSQYQ